MSEQNIIHNKKDILDKITGNDVFLYYFCWKKLANESIDAKHIWNIKEKMHPFVQHLMEDGKKFEKIVIDELKKTEEVVNITGNSNQNKYDKTLEAMKQGVKYIYQGVIINEKESTLGIPDLLIRDDSKKSNLGEYHYVPADIKNSHDPKGEQIAQVVHYKNILTEILGMVPANAFLFNQSRIKDKVFDKYGFVPDNLKELTKNKETIRKERLAAEKSKKGIESTIKSIKEEYQGKEKDSNYYSLRRNLRSSLITSRAIFGKLEDKESLLDNALKIAETSIEIEQKYDKEIKDIKNIKSGKLTVTPTISSDCTMCEYKHHCLETAIESNDISVLNKVGKAKKIHFLENGIETIEDFLEYENPLDLVVKGLGEETIKSLRTKALAYKENRLLTYLDNELIESVGGKPLEKPKMYEPNVGIQIDFEADEATGNMIMIGINVREKSGKTYAKTFFAETPNQEKDMLIEFLDYMSSIDEDVQLYHYSAYEKTHFNNMFDKYYNELVELYGDKYFDLEDKVMDNLVDLYPLATKCLAAPINSFSIKVLLPKVFGFYWREDSEEGKMDGAKFEEVYKSYIQSKDLTEKEHLKKVMFEYNQDDVIGPWNIYDKLLELSKL